MNRLSIYISSFDGYSDLWDTFFVIFDKYWENCSYEIYLVNNTKLFEHKKVNVIHTGNEISWFDRTIRSLQEINTEYILFMLEDYYISKPINEMIVEEILDFIEEDGIYYYRLSPHIPPKRNGKYSKVKVGSKYPISLQPGIWKREKLIEILKKINAQTPWDFENYFDNYNFGKEKYITGVIDDNRDILGYKNGVIRGKWIGDTVKYYRKKGINIDTKKRGIFLEKTYRRFIIADYIGGIIPNKLRRLIRGIVEKIGIKYL